MSNINQNISHRIDTEIKDYFIPHGRAICENVQQTDVNISFICEWDLEVRMTSNVYSGVQEAGKVVNGESALIQESQHYKESIERGSFPELNSQLLNSVRSNIGQGLASKNSFKIADLNYNVTNIYQCQSCNGHAIVHCQSCRGSGRNTCNHCGGNNWIYCNSCGATGRTHDGHSCNYCMSSGKVRCNSCYYEGYNACSRCGGRGTVGCYDCNATGSFSKVMSFSVYARPKITPDWDAETVPQWASQFINGSFRGQYDWISIYDALHFNGESIVNEGYPVKTEVASTLYCYRAEVQYLDSLHVCELYGLKLIPFSLGGIGDDMADLAAYRIPKLVSSNENCDVLSWKLCQLVMDAVNDNKVSFSDLYPVKASLVNLSEVEKIANAYSELKDGFENIRGGVVSIKDILLRSIPYALVFISIVFAQKAIFMDSVDFSKSGLFAIATPDRLQENFTALMRELFSVQPVVTLGIIGGVGFLAFAMNTLLLVSRTRHSVVSFMMFLASLSFFVLLAVLFIPMGGEVSSEAERDYFTAFVQSFEMTLEAVLAGMVFGFMHSRKKMDQIIKGQVAKLNSNNLLRDLGYK